MLVSASIWLSLAATVPTPSPAPRDSSATIGIEAPETSAPNVPWAGAAALVGLAVVAWAVSRRRPGRVRALRVSESVGVGPRRSLVVVEWGGETLLVGVSEAGISLLRAKPSEASPEASPLVAKMDSPAATSAAPAAPPSPREFDQWLSQAEDEQALARKLAAFGRESRR